MNFIQIHRFALNFHEYQRTGPWAHSAMSPDPSQGATSGLVSHSRWAAEATSPLVSWKFSDFH